MALILSVIMSQSCQKENFISSEGYRFSQFIGILAKKSLEGYFEYIVKPCLQPTQFMRGRIQKSVMVSKMQTNMPDAFYQITICDATINPVCIDVVTPHYLS